MFYPIKLLADWFTTNILSLSSETLAGEVVSYFIFDVIILAALLGVITPFCSCSAVPLFLGFIEAGVPLSVTLSFLVASPMVNEVALILLLGIFGWKIALLYITSGLIIAVVSGLVIGRMNVEHLLVDFNDQSNKQNNNIQPKMKFSDR